VAVGTHGRGFWILDDISALRQWSEAAAGSDVTLFKPATATRVRYSMYTDTPVPPDEPYAENPPDGAVIDYYLKHDATNSVIIWISTMGNRPVRSYASFSPAEPVKDVGNWPAYWFRPPQVPSTKAGLNRFVWDLHFMPPDGACSLPISATPHNTKCEPEGIWVPPGQYKVTLAGQTQIVTVRMDPRVKTDSAGLQQQSTLSRSLYEATFNRLLFDTSAVRVLRRDLADRKSKAASLSAQIDALDKKAADLDGLGAAGGRGGRGGGGGAPAQDSFTSVTGEIANVTSLLQGSDEAPTSVVVAAAQEALRRFDALEARWKTLVGTDVAALNVALKAAGLQPVLQGTSSP
jgi:hypothetical protein